MHSPERTESALRDTRIIQSLDKGLFVLELIEQAGQPIGLNELKLKLGWDKATVHRILATLERRGYLLRNPQTKKFSLGLKVYGLYDSLMRNFDIHETTRPFLVKVAEQTGEFTHLAVAIGKEIVFIDRIASTEVLSVNTQIGAREPLFCTALGRAVLAFVPQAEIENYLPRPFARYTSRTITSRAALKTALEEVREKGFAVDNEEYIDRVRCVAAPVFNHAHAPIAAIGISGPVSRITPQKAEQFGSLIREAAIQISECAGWNDALGKSRPPGNHDRTGRRVRAGNKMLT
jgi:DNA-binding IclR family transcriptional regulator